MWRTGKATCLPFISGCNEESTEMPNKFFHPTPRTFRLSFRRSRVGAGEESR